MAELSEGGRAVFGRVLIANRGEIACRVIRTCRRLGVATVAVYSEADRGARHVALADEAYLIGPPPARASYLNVDAILEAARRSGAEAIHPGYGFLAENAAFARACAGAGLAFIGPPAEAIEAMGAKDRAKALMAEAGVPLVPGYHGEEQSPEALLAAAEAIGWPVLVKAAAGGGGKAMRVVERPGAFAAALEGARREAAASFGDDRVLLEAYLGRPRHIEAQVFGDAHGSVVHLFERDCSLQRRHQKIVEEAPAPGLTAEQREEVGRLGVRAARAVGYVNAGTVEFLYQDGAFFFIEMNTRLQVEHPVTEMIAGVDLVEWQLRVAAGEPLPLRQEDLRADGHAIEARLYAENPERGFLPSVGRLTHLRLPAEAADLRVETGVRAGDEVSPYYDPMIAKVVAWAADRPAALRRLRAALAGCEAVGVTTNLDFLDRALAHPAFAAGGIDTGFLDRAGDALLAAGEPAADDDGLLALACLALLRERAQAAAEAARRSPDPHSPWHRVDGWRLNGRAYQTLHLRDGERAITVDAQSDGHGGWLLDLPGGRARASAAAEPDGALRFEVDGRVRRGTVVRRADALHLFQGHRRARLAVWDPDAAAAAEERDDGLLTTPLPGRVARVLTAPGETVDRGAGLVIVEAMKMEHTVAAPARGRVAALHYAEGDQVEEGAVLLDFEPLADDG